MSLGGENPANGRPLWIIGIRLLVQTLPPVSNAGLVIVLHPISYRVPPPSALLPIRLKRGISPTDSNPFGMGITQPQQHGTQQQQRHQRQRSRLRHVTAQRGDQVHDDFGNSLQVAVQHGLGAQPRLGRER